MPSLEPLSGNLTRKQAAHLLRRTTFGLTRETVDQISGQTVDAAFDLIFTAPMESFSPPVDPATGTTFIDREEVNGSETQPPLLQAYFRSWWMDRMLNSGISALEKVVLFLHSHFTTTGEKALFAFPLYHQNELFRQYAFGNFRELAKKVCRDSAMSVFLDGYRNYNTQPNENFAREFMELYTIGKGEQIGQGNYTTYTEDDVREAARVLTGYIPLSYFSDEVLANQGLELETDPDTGLYKSSILSFVHDPNSKTFSAAFQNTFIPGSILEPGIESELNLFVNMIFNQDATAENICRKIYRFFVYYEITEEVEQDIIQPLAATFRNNNYELLSVFEQLFKSQHFYDADDAEETNNNIGAIIKSPVDLVLGLVKFFKIPITDVSDLENHYNCMLMLDYFTGTSDMYLYEPPEVAGWPAYHQGPSYNRNWISATTMVNRYGGSRLIVTGVTLVGTDHMLHLDIVNYVNTSGHISDPSDPNILIEELVNDLFPHGVNANKMAVLKNILTDGDVDTYWTETWIDFINGGNELTVRIRLESLINAILQSPEYQLA